MGSVPRWYTFRSHYWYIIPCPSTAARDARLSDAAQGLLRYVGGAYAGLGGRGLIWTGSRSSLSGLLVRPNFCRSGENSFWALK